MLHASRKKEAFLYLARSAAESQTRYLDDSLGFSFLKLLLYSHKKLFMHSEQG